jgi:hypothetical protein
MDRKTVTVAGAQHALSLKSTSIYALLREGRLTRVRVGGRTLVTVESIDRLIAQGIADAERERG